MRGVVFTEMIEFVEEAISFDVADKMIEMAKLDNNGAFSQGGNYPFSDLVKLLAALSEITGKSKDELLFIFGQYLFSVLVKLYGKNIKEVGSSLDFIDSVEHYVHVEVKKLYPDADLPTFKTIQKDEKQLTLIYSSEKKLESLAHGLISSCGEYFGEKLTITFKTVSTEPYQVEFLIKK